MLDMSINKFIGTLPTSFNALTKLQTLTFSYNYLHGNMVINVVVVFSSMFYVIGTLPTTLKSLVSLDGMYNSLSGKIDSMYSILLYKQLFMRYIGTIPAAFGSYTNMVHMNLFYNRLTGMFLHVHD